jgi:hypothetical protein
MRSFLLARTIESPIQDGSEPDPATLKLSLHYWLGTLHVLRAKLRRLKDQAAVKLRWFTRLVERMARLEFAPKMYVDVC